MGKEDLNIHYQRNPKAIKWGVQGCETIFSIKASHTKWIRIRFGFNNRVDRSYNHNFEES